MGSEDRCRERGYVGTINGEPNACNDKDKVEQVVAKMKMTMIDDKVKKMITRIQEVGDAMMSDQLRTVIAEIQKDGGDGRGEIYKDEGPTLDGEAGLDDVFEGEGAGLKDRRQDRHYYLLADPCWWSWWRPTTSAQ